LLNDTLAVCREVYNSMVIERTAIYEMQNKSLTRNDQNKNLTAWKKKFPELGTVHSQVLQNVSERVELAFQAFFRRVRSGEKAGYPRLKGRGVYDSITFPQLQTGGCKLVGEFIQVSKIGQVKAVVHRPLIGTPKTCIIRRQAGKWFACFACEFEPVPLHPSEEAVGIDVGLEKFAALSDGTFVENPRFFRRDEKALAKAQRKQAKTPKKSKPRRKANKVLSRIHERIRNRRHNFVHQFARRLVNEYGLIAVEKLNVKGMVKNHCLARSISDAAWSQFRSILTQKAESAVRRIVEVNPAYTSQMCSRCGNIAKKPLKERWHYCPICSLSLDRDTNAAFNILQSAVGTHSVVGIPT
jgi:putative transposase